ncbi:MAG: ribosome hibernation-promoting factor, HPF/YfiA family [Parvularculaceae bacterium]
MDIQISGKNIDLGQALQDYVSQKLEDGVRKYFDRGADAVVTFSRERHQVGCEMTTHLDSGVFLAAHDEAGDAYGAFDGAMAKLEKRVRRYKRRLKDHHANGKAAAADAALYLLAPFNEEEDEDAEASGLEPMVVAESQTKLQALTVGEAVMQLDLGDCPAVVFKNAGHGRLNVVYRRRDGHIGWIDPTA